MKLLQGPANCPNPELD